MFGLLSTMIGTKLVSSEVIAGGAGAVAGSVVTGYICSLKAQHDKNKLIMQMEGLSKSGAEFINANCKSIFENTIKQLNNLDKGCELQLNLGNLLQPEFEEFCKLHPLQANDSIFQVHQLQQSSRSLTPPDTLAFAKERTIDEYFESYLNNRQEIKSENRALAVATVQIMHNTTILLIQAMKAIASLPGQENEERLEKFKTIIKTYFNNVLNNKALVANRNKTILEYFMTTQTQRATLAEKVQEHFDGLIDQLIIEQREISVQTMSAHCTRDIYDMSNHLMEIFARLFDAQAAKDDTQISAYKLTQDMLRADTKQATGKVEFNKNGIFKLLKPLARISEELNQVAQDDDALSFVRYQDLFENPKLFAEIAAWEPGNGFTLKTPIDKNAKEQLARDITAIFKLLFICQALEKDFLQSAVQYGFKGMSEKGEYHSKRLVIGILYQETMKRLSDLLSKNRHIKELLDLMNDPKWMDSNELPTSPPGQSFISTSEIIDQDKLIRREEFITNSVFQRCLNELEFLRQRMQYNQDALGKNYVSESSAFFDPNNITKESRIYLFNVARTFEEYNLTRLLGLNPELPAQFNKVDPSENEVFTSLKFTQIQLTEVNEAIEKLSGKLHISSFFTAGKISGGQVSSYKLAFGEKEADIPHTLYQILKQMADSAFSWEDIKNSLVSEEKRLVFHYPKHGNLFSFIEYHKKLIKLQDNIREQFRDYSLDPLDEFHHALNDIIEKMKTLIQHIDLDGERVKKLKTRNKLLTRQNVQQQAEIAGLSSDIAKVKNQFQQAEEIVQELKDKNKKHLQQIEEIEQKNEGIFKLILSEFSDNVKDIKELSTALDGKLDKVRGILSRNDSSEAKEASQELFSLKQEMEGRIESIIKRFNRYEESFNKASEELRNDFQSLKSSISQERAIIEKLERQLNLALHQLEKQQERMAFYEKEMDHETVIVHKFSTLFDFLENKYSSKLSFWSSYRTVKTENILNFIELLLANQSFLKAHMDSEKNIDKQIDSILDKSKVINSYHGIFNNSSSKALIKHIIGLFQRGDLVNVLKNEGVYYHDKKITLNNNDELTFTEPETETNYSIRCRIQPMI
ncbi:Chromosome partition protein Smc [Legionella birminghamensis]|uniref:Chromosome partition protein Smc n=1 Tax=Legionella birminghamensis TaxID=28083 RepID=A0A378IEM6_9GAMM|nr:hypothetical protein [Legionella birminghamensis]KTC66846.1 Chromosome partition protein Smc [Legionella birminghamensis]STX32971.1 chromosome segregation protein SMC [Legionella birminghamensis]